MKELLEHEGRKIGMKHPPTSNRVYLGEAILLKKKKNRPVVLQSL